MQATLMSRVKSHWRHKTNRGADAVASAGRPAARFGKLVLVAVVGLALTITSACSGGGSDNSTSQTVKTLSVTMFPWAPNTPEAMAPILAEFKKETGITVNLNVVPWDSGQQKIISQFAAGTASDVIYTTTSRAPKLIASGSLASLDTDLDKAAIDKLYEGNASVVDQYKWKGSLYLAPFISAGHYWLLNTKAAKQAGISSDTLKKLADPNQVWTWSEFQSLAEKCTLTKNGKTTQWGYGYPGGADSASPFLHLYWTWGKRVVSSDGQVVLGGQATVGVLTLLDEFQRKGVLPPGAATMNTTDLASLFTQNKICFMNDGVSQQYEKLYDAGNMEIIYPPKAPDGQRGNYITYDSLAVNAHSKKKDAAWKFISFMLSNDTFKKALIAQGQFPAAGVPSSEMKGAMGKRTLAVYDELTAHFWHADEPFVVQGSEIYQIYNAETQKVLAGKATPQTAAQEMHSKVEAAMSGG